LVNFTNLHVSFNHGIQVRFLKWWLKAFFLDAFNNSPVLQAVIVFSTQKYSIWIWC